MSDGRRIEDYRAKDRQPQSRVARQCWQAMVGMETNHRVMSAEGRLPKCRCVGQSVVGQGRFNLPLAVARVRVYEQG